MSTFLTRIKTFFKYKFNREHWDTIRCASETFNWDYGFLYELMRYKLIEMKKYFETADYAIKDYDRINRDINICIKLLDILTDRVKLVEHTGDLTFNDNGNLIENSIEFYPIVYVNQRNILRFLSSNDTGTIKMYEKYPEELYMLKARHLLFKILYERIPEWWD